MSDKIFSSNIFSGDMGDMPEYVKECYAIHDKGECLEKIVDGFESIRFFVPIVVENDVKEETGFVIDSFAGEKVILAFSNIDDFNVMFPKARPMPFIGKELVALSLRMQIGRILVDKGKMNLLIGRQAVFSISKNKKWIPAWKNKSLIEELGFYLSKIDEAKGFQLRVGEKTDVELLVALDCDKNKVALLVYKLREIISTFLEFLQHVDSVEIIPLKA